MALARGGRERRRTFFGGVGDLAERQVLGESARRESLGGAGEKGEKRPAGGVGTHAPPREVGGDRSASQRLLEMRAVLERRAEQDRHLIETRAAVGLLLQETRDLHALAAFAGRREDDDVFAGRAGRRVGRKEPRLQAGQRGRWRPIVVDQLGGGDARRRALVAERHRDEHVRRPLGEHADELALELASNDHVEEDERLADEIATAVRQGDLDRGSEHARAIGDVHPRKLRLVGGEHLCHVAIGELVRRDAPHAKLVERARERAWKAGPVGDHRKPPEPSLP